jgi:formylglycine-generating enzyme required for sulfatase activity
MSQLSWCTSAAALVGFVGIVGCGDVKPPKGADAAGVTDASHDGSVDDAMNQPPLDAPPQFSSCTGLATTCGSGANDNCCAAATVPGDTFYRSYDVANDTSYKDMGAPATVSTFKLDKYEVTVGRFRKFVNAGFGTQGKAPAAGTGAHPALATSGWDSAWNASLAADTTSLVGGLKCNANFQTWTDAAGNKEALPINCVTWYEAMAFCIWDGGYLPSEAEWNFAASGGTEQRAYPWSNPAGSVALDCSYANYNPGGTASPCVASGANRVGSESPKGDGRWGHSDLAGNVTEWLLDSYGPYVTPCTDCAPTIGGNRVVRGGSVNVDVSFLRPYLRAAERFTGTAPTARSELVGFRCARMP